VAWSLTLPVAPSGAAGISPAAPHGAKNPFHRQRSNAAAFQIRSAFRRGVPVPCPSLSRGARLPDRHWYLRLSRLGPASDTHSLRSFSLRD